MTDNAPATVLPAKRLAEIEAAVTADGLTEGPWEPLYEGCDCGGDYGCRHGQYVWAIHTPVPSPRWTAGDFAKRPDGTFEAYAYQRSELGDFTSADLEFVTEARTAVPELVAEVKRLTAELAKYTGGEPASRAITRDDLKNLTPSPSNDTESRPR